MSVLGSVGTLRQFLSDLSAHWHSRTGRNKALADHLDHSQTLAAFQGPSQTVPPKARKAHSILVCMEGKRKQQGGRGSRSRGEEHSKLTRGGGGEPGSRALSACGVGPEERDEDNRLGPPGCAPQLSSLFREAFAITARFKGPLAATLPRHLSAVTGKIRPKRAVWAARGPLIQGGRTTGRRT